MPDQTRHAELVALLNKISEESVSASNVLADMLDLLRDRLPGRAEVKVAPFDPDLIARNLEAIKHEVETPMRGHGECCDPAPADDGLAEWERELLRPTTCCGKCPPIAGGGYDCTCEGNPRCEKAGTPEEWHADPAPADALPGEPVEPGDLRAGDRVTFTYRGTGQRITCALVDEDDGDFLRSDAPDSGNFLPNVVFRGEWCHGISDVRLIEREADR